MTGDHSASAPTDSEAPLRIDVQRGQPTAEELAAVIAVVSESYAAEASMQVVDERRTVTGWSLSTRQLRQPLRRELGWGRFGG